MVLPKGMRIKGHKCFDYIHKHSKRYNSDSVILKVAKAKNNLLKNSINFPKSNSFRCAISISNKVSKKAVIRNRLRRLFHQYLRENFYRKSKFLKTWALISLKANSLDKKPEDLLKECDNLFVKAGFSS